MKTHLNIKVLSLLISLLLLSIGQMEARPKYQKATFAGGCFWCMEPPFEKLKGVIGVISGYSGGQGENPTYKNYASKGHIEVVQITYDPSKITYTKLLNVYWRQINPTDAGGQFVDRGYEYSTAIFYHNPKQKRLAIQSKKAIIRSKIFKNPIVTPILKAKKFYPAEAYHQDFYKTNPARYYSYRRGSGRDDFLMKIWGSKK